jgi:uncharacterized RDD family membrane protein YckC
MNCPVCKRTLAPTLSICLTCGAMMNDSVREELQTKIGVPTSRPETPPAQAAQAPTVSSTAPKREIARPAPPLKRTTSGLSGPKTNPTLVEFQSRNATLPDWRLQLQNTVRQRKGGLQRGDSEPAASQARLVTHGANALKAEFVDEPKSEPNAHSNPKIANALRRIDESRKTFLPESGTPLAKTAVARSYPFNVVSRSQSAVTPALPEQKPVIRESPKPTLVPTFKIDKRKYDTNKLVPLAEEPVSKPISKELPAIEKPSTPIAPAKQEIAIHITRSSEALPDLIVRETIEDLAPISMRFNAALFDLIIGGFAGFVILSPIVLIGGDWFSASGLAAFGAVWAVVLFVYMTISIGMYGKTIGMRMFGLELIDADENDYPTFHQAAVHSAVFLLSLPFFGAGFLPMIFNEEQRAAHDLAAGTIIVTEF